MSEDLSYWVEFVARFFSPAGTLRHTLQVTAATRDLPVGERPYDISYAALPRYFYTHFDSGVKSMQLVLNKGTRDKPLPNDCHLIETNHASFVYWFETGSHVSGEGRYCQCLGTWLTLVFVF